MYFIRSRVIFGSTVMVRDYNTESDTTDISGAWLILGIVGIGLLVSVMWAITSFRSTTQETVSAVGWTREIRINVWATVRHDEWSLPAGGRLVSTYRAVHHYDRVRVGSHRVSYDCGTTGNPKRCTRYVSDYADVPQYRDRFVYDIDEWTYARSLTRSGSDKDASWADVTDLRITAADADVSFGDEQIAAYIGHYYIALSSAPTMATEITFSDWQQVRVGTSVVVERDAFNSVVRLQFIVPTITSGD